jgi:DeoR/GlpR family transcriptional regulator of sugar metabolism
MTRIRIGARGRSAPDGAALDAIRRAKEDRRQLILAELRTSPAVRIPELAQRLSVSGETIRRDLAELHGAGLINRIYGGATLRRSPLEPPVSERGMTRIAERARIGEAAAREIADGQIVLIDGGSTTLQVMRQLARTRHDLTVVTNGLGIAQVAGANDSFRVYLCPGIYDPREGSVLGEDAIGFISRFRADVAVIGASGLTIDGPCDAVSSAAAVKRAMIARAAESMLVIDGSKFGQSALETVCGLDGLTKIVTDAPLPPELQRAAARTALILA